MPGVFRSIEQLGQFDPDFISVTYGAGGSTQARTVEIVVRAKNDTALTVMSHITCAAQTKEAVHGVLQRLEREGIENVIALRGDPPRGQEAFVPVTGGFAHATDLIRHIKENFGFGIAAACYPEGHIESPDLQTDIEYAKMKVELGAEFLITQLFYDNAYFYDFLDRARKVGISVPIIAGVLPILSAPQIRRFTSLCGSKIPPALDAQLDRLGEDDDAVRELGIEYATEQVRDLWDNGVQGIHFYALNRSYSISKILTNLGLGARAAR